MEYKTVKYSNDLNELNLENFSLIDRRFFFAFLYVCRDCQADDEIVLTRKELLNLGIFPSGSRITLKRYVREISRVISRCKTFTFYKDYPNPTKPDEGEIVFFDLFYDFRLKYDRSDEDRTTLHFKIHKDAIPFISNLMDQYTLFQLEEYQSLKSRYSQSLFIHLKQFRSTRKFYVTTDYLKNILNIPVHYKQSNIDQRILKPAMRELETFFPGITYKKLKNGEDKRKVSHYLFEWQEEAPKNAPKALTTKSSKKNTSSKSKAKKNSKHNRTLLKGDPLPTVDEVKHFLEDQNCSLSIYEALDILDKKTKEDRISDWQAYLLGAAQNKSQKKSYKEIIRSAPLDPDRYNNYLPELLLKTLLEDYRLINKDPVRYVDSLAVETGIDRNTILKYLKDPELLEQIIKNLS